MCQYPLFETLALIDGAFRQSKYHQQRIEFAFKYYFKTACYLNLADIIIPQQYLSGFYRCRIDYNAENYQIAFFTYQPKDINYYQCVYTKKLDYQFKYSDRKRLDFGKNLQQGEVIIINNGFVSDCTIGNLLFLKNGKWYCSADYLLKGTQLSALLAEQKVHLAKISADDLFDYEQIMMINALNPFDCARALPISFATILR